jgi:hypothetical protein
MKKIAMDAETHSRPIRYSVPISKVGVPLAEGQAAPESVEEMTTGTGA